MGTTKDLERAIRRHEAKIKALEEEITGERNEIAALEECRWGLEALESGRPVADAVAARKAARERPQEHRRRRCPECGSTDLNEHTGRWAARPPAVGDGVEVVFDEHECKACNASFWTKAPSEAPAVDIRRLWEAAAPVWKEDVNIPAGDPRRLTPDQARAHFLDRPLRVIDVLVATRDGVAELLLLRNGWMVRWGLPGANEIRRLVVERTAATPGPAAPPARCPTCDSHTPHLHPAVQHEGEVEVCKDPWHDRREGEKQGDSH